MVNAIDKARRWLIRKLGGVENTAIPKTEYRIMRTSMEHLRQRLVFTREESEYITPDFIRARLVHELADKIAGRVRIQKSGDDHYGDVVIYEMELWVAFDPPVPTRVCV